MALNALLSAGTSLTAAAMIGYALVVLIDSLAAIMKAPPDKLPEVIQALAELFRLGRRR
jgi:CRISPR/Cas system-associated endonuclease Cas1